jgi:signal transduction histidine kinase
LKSKRKGIAIVGAAKILEPTAEVERQLASANSQLALYARDLKRLVDAERQHAQELAYANARLQILDRLKTDFLTFISHELRTPLNHLAAFELLDPQGDSQDQAEVIDIIRRGYARLREFMQKGLEYFQWLAIERVETTETADLTAVVRLVASRLSGLAEPGADFRLSASDVSCLVRGEERYLVEVLHILLDNAIKFSPQEKTIKVEACATAEQVILTVTDQGQGFPPELAQELFRPFTVADVTHHSQGTGLNLALASAIVAAYGGRVRAESKGFGQGATFILEFPRVFLPEEAVEEERAVPPL